LRKELVVRSVEDFFVTNSRLDCQLDDVRGVKRPDEHFQTTELVPTGGPTLKVVSADFRAPTLLADDCLKTKSWKMIDQFFQTVLDVLREFESIFRVKRFQLLFTEGLLGCFSSPGISGLLPSDNRPF